MGSIGIINSNRERLIRLSARSSRINVCIFDIETGGRLNQSIGPASAVKFILSINT